MFDTPVGTIMRRDVLVATPKTSVSEAAKLMAERKVGAILVANGNGLAGIFTERDLLCRVVASGRDAKKTKLEDVMTADPETIHPRTPFGHALVVMQENGFRHLPVIEDGKPVGMISARNAMDPELEEFRSESLRREFWKKVVHAKR
ncbi:MAG TPA: CBS domain-containing protein [Usitatibacter sp.]|nr:CBS domain-containing protein [Usitatibacter sp.]